LLARAERCGHHPQREVGADRHPQQVVQLIGHHRGTVDRGAQHELVRVEGEVRRTLPAEQTLPGQPGGHPILDLASGRSAKQLISRVRPS